MFRSLLLGTLLLVATPVLAADEPVKDPAKETKKDTTPAVTQVVVVTPSLADQIESIVNKCAPGAILVMLFIVVILLNSIRSELSEKR